MTPDAPQRVWARLWDLDRHTATIPLTTVRSVDGRPLRAGSRFVGRTGVGLLGFDDRMFVREWVPPRRAVVEKVGWPLRGRIVVAVEPYGSGSWVRWSQTYSVWGLPGVLIGLAAPLLERGYQTMVARIIGATG